MPSVNVKVVKSQVDYEKKKRIAEGLTELIVNVMERDRDLTVITIDEMEDSQWAVGGQLISENKGRKVSSINIRVSKGTVTEEQAAKMLLETKKLMTEILDGFDVTNYFVIEELNPELWGFDDLSMMERRRG